MACIVIDIDQIINFVNHTSGNIYTSRSIFKGNTMGDRLLINFDTKFRS